MKNLSYYSNNTFDFHKEVLKSKNKTNKDPEYKERIGNLDDAIKDQFLLYDKSFFSNTLEKINSHGHSDDEKRDLLKLYSYKSAIIKRLKINITTTDTNRIINTCPNCTISEINSFDHYLPKELFPEFVVNPKNLFPSCTICNGYKSTRWINNGKRLFLNLYLDLQSPEQYLYANLIFDKDVVTALFFLKNNGGISDDDFEIIESHYSKLHLLERFCLSSNEVITSLENTISSFAKKLAIDEIKELSIEKSEKDKIAFGQNYWKSVLEIALINSDEYMVRFYT